MQARPGPCNRYTCAIESVDLCLVPGGLSTPRGPSYDRDEPRHWTLDITIEHPFLNPIALPDLVFGKPALHRLRHASKNLQAKAAGEFLLLPRQVSKICRAAQQQSVADVRYVRTGGTRRRTL